MNKQRYAWLDMLKGFGILLVFLGHTTLIDQMTDHYIFSFHMPLFFFISGFFYKLDNAKYFRNFLIKEIKTRMLPYFTFGLLTYVIWLFPFVLRKYGIYQGTTIIPESLFYKPLVGMFYGNGINGWMIHNVMLWFLACLFITEIFFYCINYVVKKKHTIILVLLLFAILGQLDSVYSTMRLPFSIDIALTAVVFYGLGCMLRDYLLKLESSIGVGVLFILVGMGGGFLNERIDMNLNTYGNPFLFYLSAFSSIYGYVCLAKKIPAFISISYIGQNSLIFFLLQNSGFIVANIILYLLFSVRIHSLAPNLIFAVGYVLLSLIVLFPLVIIINKKIPIIAGRLP